MKIFDHVARTFSVKIGVVFFSLLSGMISARWLGPTDRGVLAVITSIAPTVWVLVNIGTNQASIYYLNKGKYKINQVIANCAVTPIVLSSIAIAGIWTTKELLIFKFLPLLNTQYLLLALFPLPILIVQDSFMGVLRAEGKFDILNLRSAIRAIIGLVVSVLVLIILGNGLNELLICIISVEYLMSAWIIREVFKLSTVKISDLSKEIIFCINKFGSKSYLQNMIGYLHNRIDFYMIAYYLTPNEVSFYDIAVIIGELLLFLPQSITFVILPNLVRDSNSNKNELILRYCFYATIAFATCMLIFGYLFINIVYGADYLSAYPLLLVLLPGLITSSFNGITVPYFTSINKQGITVICCAFSLLLNVALNIHFIPKWGSIGAATVTTVTYSFFSFCMLFMYKKETKIAWSSIFILQKKDITAAYGYLLVLFKKYKIM